LKEIVRPRRFTEQYVVRIASHLTERDRQIAVDCFDHRVLTTDQIKRLHFTDTRTTVARLDVLYRLRVLDRFRPSRPRGRGTAPYHWTLDEGGALIVATEKGMERSKLGWQHAVAVGVATSPKLTHHVEVNEFVVRLAVEAQAVGGMLTHWYGERWLHRAFDGILLPDTYAALGFPDRPALHMLVELDRATETLETLRDKAERYERRLDYKFWREVDPLVLFVVPSEGHAHGHGHARRDEPIARRGRMEQGRHTLCARGRTASQRAPSARPRMGATTRARRRRNTPRRATGFCGSWQGWRRCSRAVAIRPCI
jgi:hypothetical protein